MIKPIIRKVFLHMKKGSFLLTLVAAAVILVSGGMGGASTVLAAQVNSTATAKDFQNHPNKTEIEYVIKSKLMWLFPDGNFRPDQVITQADLIAGLSNVKGLTVGEQVPEMPANHWAKTYYERAKKEGILIGVEINPNKVLTRDEAARLMINAWEDLRQTRTQNENGTSAPYPYSQLAVSNGWLPKKAGKFINGVSTTLYDGVTNTTRAEQAFALASLHRDLVGIRNGEKISSQLHNSLKLSNGRLTGQVPNMQGYSASVLIMLKDGKTFEYKSGAFSVDVNQAKAMRVRVTRKGEAISLSLYTYLKLPHSLERVNVRW